MIKAEAGPDEALDWFRRSGYDLSRGARKSPKPSRELPDAMMRDLTPRVPIRAPLGSARQLGAFQSHPAAPSGRRPPARFLAWSDWIYSRLGKAHGIPLEALYEGLHDWLASQGVAAAAYEALVADYVATGACGRLSFAPSLRPTPPIRLGGRPRRDTSNRGCLTHVDPEFDSYLRRGGLPHPQRSCSGHHDLPAPPVYEPV